MLGEYNNIKFHKIISKNLNKKESDNEFIIIIQLFDYYKLLINYFKSSFDKIESLENFENLLIIFHSLIQCITEYTNIDEIKDKIKNIF